MEAIGFTTPALEGTSITLRYPSGLMLIGPGYVMCMGNGRWEPDPMQVECIGKNDYYGHSSTLYA